MLVPRRLGGAQNAKKEECRKNNHKNKRKTKEQHQIIRLFSICVDFEYPPDFDFLGLLCVVRFTKKWPQIARSNCRQKPFERTQHSQEEKMTEMPSDEKQKNQETPQTTKNKN